MRHLICTVALAATAPLAIASDLPLWELGIGVGGLRLPHYRGSDQSHTWVLPVPYVVYRGPILKADRSGARALLVESDRFDLDISLSAGAPARSRDNLARRGMADLDPTVELGPSANWTLARHPGWQLDLRAPVRAVFTVDRDPKAVGWSASPHLNLDWLAAGPWKVGIQAGPVFGSRRLHRHFYDVPQANAQPGRPAYHAAGGYGAMQATMAVSRRFDSTWLGAFARFDQLSGARFDDSPLVRRRQNVSFGLAVSWVLATSSRPGVPGDASE